jgi:nucleotidyltransferase substrate binding protein (TIGR01987 family)
MSNNQDTRWQQRFSSFEKAFSKLKDAIEEKDLNELERNGLVQRFEFTLDLSWKVMKDFLEYKGFSFKPSPKDTFRQAFESGYIGNAQALIDGLVIRNELSHDYSGEKFEKSEKILRTEVFPALENLHQFFTDQLAE